MTKSEYLKLEKAFKKDLKNGVVKRHHAALGRGYICVNACALERYEGRFGKGYLTRGTFNTRYHTIVYYTDKGLGW